LDRALRSCGDAWRTVRIARFSKLIDRLGPIGARLYQPVPLLRHKGILIFMASGDERLCLRLEFVMEGLRIWKVPDDTIEIPNQQTWDESQLELSATELANMLQKLRGSYDAIRWNCQHFADELWAECTGQRAKERSLSPDSGARDRGRSLSSWFEDDDGCDRRSSSPTCARRFKMSICNAESRSSSVPEDDADRESRLKSRLDVWTAKLDGPACEICAVKLRQVVLVPCGHFTCCASCADSVSECPSCQAQIQLRQQVVRGRT
jgi:hypothetical protein